MTNFDEFIDGLVRREVRRKFAEIEGEWISQVTELRRENQALRERLAKRYKPLDKQEKLYSDEPPTPPEISKLPPIMRYDDPT